MHLNIIRAAHVTTLAKGGQILLSPEAYAEVKTKQELQDVGQFIASGTLGQPYANRAASARIAHARAGKYDLGQTICRLYEYRPSSLITRFVGTACPPA
jgi:hypothetical protein